MSKGWVYLHRSIFDSPFYFAEKFTKSQAWIDLLLLANHKTGYIDKRGNLIEVKRGYVGYSKKALMIRWKWSSDKVNKFIKDLTGMGQISEQKIAKITTLLQILNYDKYQPKSEQTSEQINEQKVFRKRTESEQKANRKVLTSNDKELKNEKELKETHTQRAEKFRQNAQVLLSQCVNPKTLEDFITHWCEKSPQGRKMAFEKQKVFDMGKRFATWKDNNFNKTEPVKSKQGSIINL